MKWKERKSLEVAAVWSWHHVDCERMNHVWKRPCRDSACGLGGKWNVYFCAEMCISFSLTKLERNLFCFWLKMWGNIATSWLQFAKTTIVSSGKGLSQLSTIMWKHPFFFLFSRDGTRQQMLRACLIIFIFSSGSLASLAGNNLEPESGQFILKDNVFQFRSH